MGKMFPKRDPQVPVGVRAGAADADGSELGVPRRPRPEAFRAGAMMRDGAMRYDGSG